MKYSILIFLFLFALNCKAQRLDIKTIDNLQYFIRQDTSIYGVITITKTPITELAKEIESQINSIDGEVLNLTESKNTINLRLNELQLQRKQLLALKTKLGL